MTTDEPSKPLMAPPQCTLQVIM